MTKKNGKEIYEPPKAINLSAFSADGQDQPLGVCEDGHSPISNTCAAGPGVTQADTCSPVGNLPTYGRCDTGGHAAEGCSAGSSVADCVEGGTFS